MKKITIVYIIDFFYKFAGAERNLFEVVDRLDKKLYTPIIYALQADEMLNVFREKGIAVRNMGLKRIYDIKACVEAIQLFWFLLSQKIDMVVTYHEGSDFFGGLLAYCARVPVIISNRRDMGYKLKRSHIFLYSLLNNILFDAIITVSGAVKDIIIAREKTLFSKLKIIHNGVNAVKYNAAIDTESFKRKLGITNSYPTVGIIASIRPIKGHEFFIRAAALVLKKIPAVNFLIIGWQNPKNTYVKKLHQLVEEFGIGERVLFIRGIDDNVAIHKILDVSVISSINEGFSNTVIESMAAAKPVIGTSSGGTPEAVINDVTGILVPPSNAEELAYAILKLLKNPDTALAYGIAGRKRVMEQFTVERMVRQTEALYEKLLISKTSKKQYNSANTNPIFLLKRILKHGASCALRYSGIISMLEQSGILILAYHRVDEEAFDPLSMNVHPADFEKQMIFLKNNYTVVSLEEALRLLKTGERKNEHFCVITFDDGYRNNLTHAFPILSCYKIPATVFLSVQAVHDGKHLWYDTIVSLIRRTNARSVDLRQFDLGQYAFMSVDDKAHACRNIIHSAKYMNAQKRDMLIDELSKQLRINSRDDAGKEPSVLSWNDIAVMKANELITFGSHGMSHVILTTMDSDEQRYEITESKKMIRDHAGINVEFFTYPNGSEKDFNGDVVSLLQKNGYRAACSLIPCINREVTPDTIFALKRMCITKGMFTGAWGSYSESVFKACLSGLIGTLS